MDSVSKFSKKVVQGPVNSILEHVKSDWWADAFNEVYLRTDGDVVENPAITELECQEILKSPLVADLFAGADKNGNKELSVLDLCCGQGRHGIYLAQKFPYAKFHGHDQSTYLVDIAKSRTEAVGCQNVTFSTGLANQIPGDDGQYDMVLLMGNSFGYSELPDDVKLIKEIYRVLKPGGIFLLDLPDAGKMRSDIKDRSWEWVDGRESTALLNSLASAENRGEGRKLLACRERELNPEQDRLAAREIVIDLEQGVIADLFYSVRIYGLAEIDKLLEQHGLSTGGVQANQTDRPDSHRNEDLGMMEHRHLVVAQKPNFSGKMIEVDDDMTFFVHPNLIVEQNPNKGNLISTTAHIKAGTLLMMDKAHAIVPSIDPTTGESLICSRYECSKRMPLDTSVINCECNPHIVWCDKSCQDLDQKRHTLEHTWLKEHSITLTKSSKYDFNMLWLIVRILSRRHLELNNLTPADIVHSPNNKNVPPFGSNDWKVVQTLLSNKSKFPPDRVTHWTSLSETYIANTPLASGLTIDDIVDLICKEETNSFCLYPKPTGIFPVPGPSSKRGVPYGLAFYTRATLVNHSCLPNVMHAPDHLGRMVFHASRNIRAGEECCIAYFDLVERSSLEARRELLEHYFRFECDCVKCVRESSMVNLAREQGGLVVAHNGI